MKALYIGFSKCGTKTMHVVFETLGYKCYDYEDNFVTLGDDWERILKHGCTAEDFKRMYKDIDCAVDTPVYFFWEEILEAFPDTKLLVFYREEEPWFKSWTKLCNEAAKDNMFKLVSMLSPTAYKMVRRIQLAGCHLFGSDRDAWPWEILTGVNPTLLLKRYRQHNLYIQQNAPKDQLHVVDFKKGWGPICEFLGKPVPDVEFPHANKANQVLKESMEKNPIFIKMKNEFLMSICILIVLFSIAMYYVFFRV